MYITQAVEYGCQQNIFKSNYARLISEKQFCVTYAINTDFTLSRSLIFSKVWYINVTLRGDY